MHKTLSHKILSFAEQFLDQCDPWKRKPLLREASFVRGTRKRFPWTSSSRKRKEFLSWGLAGRGATPSTVARCFKADYLSLFFSFPSHLLPWQPLTVSISLSLSFLNPISLSFFRSLSLLLFCHPSSAIFPLLYILSLFFLFLNSLSFFFFRLLPSFHFYHLVLGHSLGT